MKIVEIGFGGTPKTKRARQAKEDVAAPAEESPKPKRKRKAKAEATGGAVSADMKRRNQLVKHVMQELGISLPQASHYVKQHNLA